MKKTLMTLVWVLMMPFVFAQEGSPLLLEGSGEAPIWTVETVPNTRLQSDFIHISDPDDWVTDEVESKINGVLDGIRQQADVFVVVLSSVGDEPGELFANELFNKWGIGEAGLDNGVLMLMVEDQHLLRFEVGYGVEDELPDALCQQIFTKVIVPYFREGKYNDGLYAGVCAVADVFGALPEDSEVTHDQIVALKSAPEASRGDNSDMSYFEIFMDEMGSFGWVIVAVLALLNIAFAYLMIHEMQKIKKEADPQHGDSEKVAKLFKEAKTGMVMYPVVALICCCPLALLVYPFYLSFVKKKQKSYRDTPRVCEYCGREMRRLSEEEENAYMTDNQIFEEENVKVKDYDIWLCDSCGNKMAIPFLLSASSSYYTCTACQCLAGKKDHDSVIEPATTSSRGRGLHHIVCQKCGHHFTIEYSIPMKSSSSSSGSSHRSSSGGGSFGGGRSGGGGYSGRW